MKNIDLSIIIVSFNTAGLTVACLRSLFEYVKDLSFEVIVVDNNSKDDSIEKIQNAKFKMQNYNSKVKIIANKENVGFSRANNIGIKKSSGRYVLFLNSDTVVPEKTLEVMVRFMDEHRDAGAATCFVRMANDELDDAAHRGFPTPWNAICHFSGLSKVFPHSMLFNGYHMAWKDLHKTHEIDALAGAFMIVRREAGEQAGWWDEDYFFYGEDIDFCYVLKEKGWKIYFVPEVEILHYKGASGGIKKESEKITTASLETKRWVTNQRFNAMKTFYKKHYVGKYPRFLTGL
ncbi:MAG: glycosyltransferase family 2 protein, partial [Candidatus Levybacteria bacterium]|nr:glycosyltransferase family 2 protein [Candidatus Levybacteria bacterium]